MQISRTQEEVLLVLKNSSRQLCLKEILNFLNSDRLEDWEMITEPFLFKTLGKMVVSELINLSKIDRADKRKKYYQINEKGYISLLQTDENRKRLIRKLIS